MILAAGFSRRFGPEDKRTHAIEIDGRTDMLALHTVARYASVFDDVIVVIRTDDDRLRDKLARDFGAAPNVRIVATADAHLGMAHSLAAGARAIADGTAVFVALADMPFITADTLTSLAGQLVRGEQIVVPEYEGNQGHPVGFGSNYLQALRLLTGDRGARSILAEHGDCTVSVPCRDPGVVKDLDHPPD